MSMSNKEIALLVFGFLLFILVINLLKFIFNFFSNRKRYQEVYEVREAVNSTVRPHLHTLEKKYETQEEKPDSFGKYVFGVFRDKFKGKDEKIVEKEICRCCSEYEKAECKEDYCLAGAGVSCSK